MNAIVIGIVGFNVLTALNPASPTFSSSNQADVKKRPSGPIQNPKINPISDPQAFLGIDKGFGFTRKNELFVGRMAMIGFASAIIGVSLALCMQALFEQVVAMLFRIILTISCGLLCSIYCPVSDICSSILPGEKLSGGKGPLAQIGLAAGEHAVSHRSFHAAACLLFCLTDHLTDCLAAQ